MPRKASSASNTQHLHQQSLLDFVPSKASSSRLPLSSSPARPSRGSHTSRPTKRRRLRRAQSDSESSGGTSSDVQAIHFEPRSAISVSSENDENDLVSPLRPTQSATMPSTRRVVTSDQEQGDGGDIPAPAKKRGRELSAISISSDEESVIREPVKRRRLVKGNRPSTPESEEEVDSAHILESRLRTRGKRSEYQRSLDRLKLKKGKAVASSSSSDDSDEEVEESSPFIGAKPDRGDENHSDADTEDADADNFIVEDDEKTVTPLPAAFSMSTHQDLTHHFKIICQLFVHMAVRPSAERQDFMKHVLKEDEYFSIPLQMTRDKLSGLRDSVMSSVWRPKLRKSFQSYPTYHLYSLDYAIPHCDACNLGGRMSTLLGKLEGGLYDKHSYETIEIPDDDGEDSADEDDEDSLQTEYNLGRFCAARTKVYHRLTHWEYHLFHAVLDEIDQLRGKGKFVRVAYYKGMLPPSDLSDADGIMDWLDQRGFVNMEWHKIKEMMNSVRKVEQHQGKEEDFDPSDI